MSDDMSISVKYQALDSGSTGINRTYTSLVNTLSQLESDLAPLSASWSGNAQQAFAQCKKQWQDAASGLAQLLSNIGAQVANTNDNFRQTDAAVEKNWNNS